ncbi:MAG: hypothetical protein WCH21_12420 [Bacteroidota bacterium]
MVKYLQTIVDRLKKQAKGIHDNSGDWTGQPVSEALVNTKITLLEGKGTAITNAENALKQANLDAHNATPDAKTLGNQVENLVNGIYASNPGKKIEYGVTEPAPGTPQPAPNKGVVKPIHDDVDGEGFILERETLVNADTYEWQKAAGTDATVLVIDPSKYEHFKITKKQKFVDDAVSHGIRYFYRMRGVNPNHNGEWSGGVSGLQ